MFSISITQIASGVGGMAWLFRTHISESWHEQRWPLGIPFALFALACLVAVFDAFDVSYSYTSLKKLLEILVFFWVLNCVRNNRLRDSLSLVLIASATFAGLFGFYEAWRDGVANESRVDGSLSSYMTFAGLLMMTGALALGRIIFRRPVQPWLWASVGVITICLLLTLTRQAWFGFLAGLIFLIFVWRKRFLLLLPVLLIATFLASPDAVKTRLTDMVSGKDVPFAMRTNLWQVGWKIFKDYPLTGCGFRCVDLVNDQYPDPYRDKVGHSHGSIKHLRGMHNNFIQLAVDTGILGLTAWLGIWVCFFRLLCQRAKSLKRDPHECWAVYGSGAAGIAFLAGGIFETNFYDSEVAMVLYFIMALPFAGFKIDALMQEDEI